LLNPHIDAIIEHAGGEIRWILCTHTHPDHSPAAAPLKHRTGARLFGMLASFSERQDSSFVPDHILVDASALHLAGCSIRALHTPGHASNQFCFLLEEERLLFTGDHIMQGSTVVINPPDGDMQAYFHSLQRLYAEPLDYFAPGHAFCRRTSPGGRAIAGASSQARKTR